MHYRTYFPVDQLAGRDGHAAGVVYFRINNLDCARRFVVPANPNTAEQAAIRGFFTQASQAFKLISDADRATWRSYAAANPRSYLGSDFTLQEMAAFVQVNTLRLINGQAISNTAPTAPPGFFCTDITEFKFTAGEPNSLDIKITHNVGDKSGFWVVRVTQALASAQRTPRSNDFRLVAGVNSASIVDTSPSPQTITIAPPLFSYSADDYVGVEIMALSTSYWLGSSVRRKLQATLG